MRFYKLLLIILLPSVIFSQNQSEEKLIDQLNQKIENSQRGEKLKWMDSLSNYIVRETNFTSDSIVKETVRVALELDSTRIATSHTANLIFYHNNRAGNAEEGKKVFLDYLEVAKSTSNHDELARYYIEGADSFYFLSQYDPAISYYVIAEDQARKAGNLKLEAIAKLYRGGTLSFKGDFPEASKLLQEASRMFELRKDTFNIISAKNTLSILYSQNAFFEEAKKERDEAITLAMDKKSYGHLISFHHNAATDAGKQKLALEEIESLNKAIAFNNMVEQPDVHIPRLYGSLIVAYSKSDSIEKAREWLDKLEQNPEKYTEGSNRATYIKSLKHYNFAKGDYNKALSYGKEYLNLSRAGDRYEDILNSEKFLADTYGAIGNDALAYRYFKSYSSLKDSITNVQKVRALSYYQTLYETEKRDAKIATQTKDIALLDAKNEIKNQWLLFGGLGLLAIFGSIILVRSRNAARRRQEMQEDFSQGLIQAQEEERTRVARELHDSVGQKLMLLTKRTRAQNDTEMSELADGTLGELRNIARGLHPATMERLGLTAALESLINEVDANTNIFFTHEITNVDALLSKDASLHLYRIMQEVLSNMVKHSEAKAASITITNGAAGIEARIKDNGKGFEFSEKVKSGSSLGMKTLMERAKILKSKLKISSAPDDGTTVLLVIPT